MRLNLKRIYILIIINIILQFTLLFNVEYFLIFFVNFTMKYTAIIMAGGAGERFWPLSRAKKPKQLLNLTNSGKNLIQEAIERVEGLIKKDDIFIITSEILQNPIRESLPELPPDNIIAEPSKRNTAPCLALAAAFITEKYKSEFDANEIAAAVLTADHLISPNDKFRETIAKALETASESGDIVTIGIKPDRPETGYGYIEVDTPFGDELSVKNVIAFREKPNQHTAADYLEAGNYYWNSGMFFFRIDCFVSDMIKFTPQIGNKISEMQACYSDSTDSKFDGANPKIHEIYNQLHSISIDYALMEKADNVAVVNAQFSWDDIGSWTSLERTKSHDENNNITEGKNLIVQTNNSIIINHNPSQYVTTYGVNDLIVVVTPDGIMITPKNDAQNVKKIVEELRKNNINELL